MKIRLTLLLCLTFVQFISFAQKKSTLAINIGASIPYGDFASKNVDNIEAGLANAGISLGLSYDYQLFKHFGIAALARLENNSFDSQTQSIGYDRRIGNARWNTTADEWNALNFLLGGFYTFNAAPKIAIKVKAMAGIINIKQPSFRSISEYQGVEYFISAEEKKASTFSYLFGTGVKFNITDKFAILAGFDFTVANPDFKNSVYDTNLPVSVPATGSVNFSTVNINTGLGYRF